MADLLVVEAVWSGQPAGTGAGMGSARGSESGLSPSAATTSATGGAREAGVDEERVRLTGDEGGGLVLRADGELLLTRLIDTVNQTGPRAISPPWAR
jgi:hypothetical protein